MKTKNFKKVNINDNILKHSYSVSVFYNPKSYMIYKSFNKLMKIDMFEKFDSSENMLNWKLKMKIYNFLYKDLK